MNPNSTQHPPGSPGPDDPPEAGRSRRAGDEAMPAADRTRRLLLGRFTPAALVGVITLLIAGGGYALASGSNSLTVCVKKNGGTVYKARKCNKHDAKLTLQNTGRDWACRTDGPGWTGWTDRAGRADRIGHHRELVGVHSYDPREEHGIRVRRSDDYPEDERHTDHHGFGRGRSRDERTARNR